jgi:hypothetical protein
VEFVSLLLEPADGLVEATRLGGNCPAVGGFGGRFGIGPALCLFSPVPPVSPACEGFVNFKTRRGRSEGLSGVIVSQCVQEA